METCSDCASSGGDPRIRAHELNDHTGALDVALVGARRLQGDHRGGGQVTVRLGSGHVRVEHPASDLGGWWQAARTGTGSAIDAGHGRAMVPPLALLRHRGGSGFPSDDTVSPELDLRGCQGPCVPVQIIGHAVAGLVRRGADVLDWILENGKAIERAKENALADHDRKLAAGFQGEPHCVKPGCACVDQHTTYPPKFSFAFTPKGQLGTVVGVHCTTSWTGTCADEQSAMP